MRRLKLKSGYHDARIRAVRYTEPDIILDVSLCGCCNTSPGPATICLIGVRNFAEVREALEAARAANANRSQVDEIIGVSRAAERGYLLDLVTAGALVVDAIGLHEM